MPKGIYESQCIGKVQETMLRDRGGKIASPRNPGIYLCYKYGHRQHRVRDSWLSMCIVTALRWSDNDEKHYGHFIP